MKNDTIGIPDKVYLHETSKYFDHSKSEHKNKQVMKNKQTGYEVYVDYHVTGYRNGMEGDGSHCFYYLTPSIKEALEGVLSDFEAYWLVRTRDPEGHYYKLDYTITGMSFEKRVLDNNA